MLAADRTKEETRLTSEADAQPRGERPAALVAAAALFGSYVLYVLVAAYAQKHGLALPFHLGDVGEFLLFLLASAAFVAGLAGTERRRGRKTILQWLDENAERQAMLVFYVFVCGVIVQEVIRRFVLNYSSAWAEETARYAFIYLGYIGAAYAVRERAHIRFDTLLHRLPPRLHGYVHLVAEIATLVFAAFALWWSMRTIVQLVRFDAASPVLRINKAWFVAALPLGFTLIVLRVVQAIVRDVADLRGGRPAFAGKAMFDD
jgi:TRAP-type C4-dicarboxylate transport system permease small subunit